MKKVIKTVFKIFWRAVIAETGLILGCAAIGSDLPVYFAIPLAMNSFVICLVGVSLLVIYIEKLLEK